MISPACRDKTSLYEQIYIFYNSVVTIRTIFIFKRSNSIADAPKFYFFQFEQGKRLSLTKLKCDCLQLCLYVIMHAMSRMASNRSTAIL